MWLSSEIDAPTTVSQLRSNPKSPATVTTHSRFTLRIEGRLLSAEDRKFILNQLLAEGAATGITVDNV